MTVSGWAPKSKLARRRLMVFVTSAATLSIAAALTLAGLRQSISYFYTPTEALARGRPGVPFQLGGLVESGSLRHLGNGRIMFRVRDRLRAVEVSYAGSPPDLFGEGQGVVASGSFSAPGLFTATEILAKHDERYLPRTVVEALKARGEWRGGPATRRDTFGSKWGFKDVAELTHR